MISEIVSIDIGFQNAAWVHMDKDKQILGWSRAEITKPKPYNPAVFKPLVSCSFLLIILLFLVIKYINVCVYLCIFYSFSHSTYTYIP